MTLALNLSLLTKLCMCFNEFKCPHVAETPRFSLRFVSGKKKKDIPCRHTFAYSFVAFYPGVGVVGWLVDQSGPIVVLEEAVTVAC